MCVFNSNIHYYELEIHLKSSYGKSQMSTELSIYRRVCSSDFHFPLFAKHLWGIKTKLLTVPTCAPKIIAKKLSPFDFFKLKLRYGIYYVGFNVVFFNSTPILQLSPTIVLEVQGADPRAWWPTHRPGPKRRRKPPIWGIRSKGCCRGIQPKDT